MVIPVNNNYINRNLLESFIREVFKKHYNADIDRFYPSLLSISNKKGEIKAAAGIRIASDEALFSEYYLNNNLESELKTIFCTQINRDQIVEIGNLAPTHPGQIRWLITCIAEFLYLSGYKYIVFTAIPGIYNAFKKTNISLTVLADANKTRLPLELQKKWGTEYYNKNPKVYACDINHGFNAVKHSKRNDFIIEIHNE